MKVQIEAGKQKFTLKDAYLSMSPKGRVDFHPFGFMKKSQALDFYIVIAFNIILS